MLLLIMASLSQQYNSLVLKWYRNKQAVGAWAQALTS